MTTSERDIYFEMLRAALWQREADVKVFAGDWDWKPVLETYLKQDLLGLVADVILRLPDNLQPSPQESVMMMNYLGNLIQAHHVLNQRLAEVMPRLEATGCRPVLLKGQGLSGLYPKTCVCACGDLDIYVGSEKFAEAKAAVGALATQEEVAQADGGEELHHYQINIGGIIYEIHHTIGEAGNEHYARAFDSLSRQHIEGGPLDQVMLSCEGGRQAVVSVPPVSFNVWYLLNHLAWHFCYFAGIGFRQFCDWLVVLREFNKQAGEQELAELKKNLSEIGMLRAWRILGGFLVHQLGLPAAEFPFYDARLAAKSQGYLLDEVCDASRFRFRSLDVHTEGRLHGLKHILFNLRFYYYNSSAQTVLSRWQPYFSFARFVWHAFFK